ncbi:sulfatase [bacterium]|nr:sulfatase [bacterium]
MKKAILIVIDTLRADHLGCYGYFRNTSPNIDKLAENGILFKNSYSTAITTGAGFTSIVTGLPPIKHRFYNTPFNIPNLNYLDDTIPTIAQVIQMSEKGITTAAFDNLMNFSSPMDHLVRGMEYYINPTGHPRKHCQLIGKKINEKLIKWIEEHKDKSFFAFVHYWDPHTPYNHPENFHGIFNHKPGNLDDLKIEKAPSGYEYVPGWGKIDKMWENFKMRYETTGEEYIAIDLYDEEIRYVDSLVGEVIEKLKELKIDEETLIIITSDHGEQLGQHNYFLHYKIIEPDIHIPIIIYCPSLIDKGKTIDGFVQHIDIAPTILSYFGIEKPSHLEGISLFEISKGRDKIFVEGHEYRGIINGKWKYIRSYLRAEEELYNLETDPVEEINLAHDEKEKLEEMRNTLNDWVRENLKNTPDPLWEEIGKWASKWSAHFKHEFELLKPKPAFTKYREGDYEDRK